MMKKSNNQNGGFSKITVVLACVALVLLFLVIILMVALPGQPEPVATTLPPTDPPATTEAPTEAPTEPPVTEPVMLENMAQLYEQNPDIAGWIRIDETKLDYPVMYTPEDEEKYLRTNFEGKWESCGLPFINTDCSMDPLAESQNLIVYGHNMRNGTGFRTLMSYDKQEFWEENPTIFFSTLYEERTYEIVACFYDRVYKKTDTCFKFYQFIDPVDETEFNEAMAYFKEKALYDTGVTAEFGDSLITLVTCSYHTDHGRFVVVAKDVTDELALSDVPGATEDATAPAAS